jgi:OHCU decarboxylase
MPLSLNQLNSAPPAEAAQMLDGLYEHSPWIAGQAVTQRPFRSLAHLKHTMVKVLNAAGRDAQLALIRAHPELAGKAMVNKSLTAESTHEQGKAGLTDCTPEEFARIQQLNADYNAKFGFRSFWLCGCTGYRAEQTADHRHLRAAPARPPGVRVAGVPAQHPPHRRAAPERQVRRRARHRQPGVGLA